MLTKVAVLAAILITLAVIFERLLTRYANDNEALRKLVHIFHGIALASLAFVVPLWWVVFLEIFFLFSMVVARYLQGHFNKVPWVRYFGRVYRVGRLSFGEFFFPISAILLVFLAESKWEFAAAVLILGIADAAAALIGKRYGSRITYKIFGQSKSLVGSLAFFAASLIIVLGFVYLSGPQVANPTILAVLLTCLAATAAENLGVYGSDNFLIPIIAVLFLNSL